MCLSCDAEMGSETHQSELLVDMQRLHLIDDYNLFYRLDLR